MPKQRSTLGVLLFVLLLLPTAGAADTDRVGVLTLINGNTVEGVLCESDSGDVIRWRGTDFVDPFEFRAGAVKSIKYATETPAEDAGEGNFSVELSSGDVIGGDLLNWSADAIELDSPQFGKLRIRPSAVRRLHRMDENATLVFASLAGLQDWTNTAWDTSGWEEDGNHVFTRQRTATLNGDLRVPDRAVIEFEISWTDQPDFVLAFGVDPASESDKPADGWRFETAGQNLAVVRQTGTGADIDLVSELTLRGRIRLTAYLDQVAGRIRVYWPDGRPAADVAARTAGDSTAKPGRGVRLINRGRSLRLERLRIAGWLGKIPEQPGAGEANVALADGDFVSGKIKRLDRASGKLFIGEDAQSSVNFDDVVAIRFAASEATIEPAQCALFLHDGMRLSGTLTAIDDRDWILSGDNLQQPVRVSRRRVRSFVVFQHDPMDAHPDPPDGRLGRLELGASGRASSHKLTGRLVAAREDPTTAASCLRWHPFGSRVASSLQSGTAGRIVYRDPPKTDKSTAAARALAMQRLRLQRQKRGLNFGELFLRRADSSKAKSIKQDSHVVHVRSGDVIACQVESIDDQGVHLKTAQSDQGLVPHADVKAIDLVSNSPPPDLQAAKRNRLLTIPRLQKSSPPSHLLCSRSGDFLRCQLLRVDEDSVYVEVQLEEVQIPRGRIAQIIWFHPDELPSAAEDQNDDATQQAEDAQQAGNTTQDPAPQRSGLNLTEMAQILRRDGKRITIDPREVSEKSIQGTSPFLGECGFDIGEMDQLIFGNRIASEVSDLAYNGWKLNAAVEPLVTQAMEGGATMGSESPLVGSPAPDVRLELLDGGEFRLSEIKGKIVVLDFWATWCAPCIQTMPLVEEAIAEFDPAEVQLVSINLEEPADHVRAVMERQKLTVPVALDIDGVAALRYDARAIPQLVIVGRDGNVERLYVGGGPKVVEEMTAAIQELLE